MMTYATRHRTNHMFQEGNLVVQPADPTMGGQLAERRGHQLGSLLPEPSVFDEVGIGKRQ